MIQRREQIVEVQANPTRTHLTALHSLADKLADKLCGEQTLAEERTQTLALGLILRLAAVARGLSTGPIMATRGQVSALRTVLGAVKDPSLASLKKELRA